MNFQGAKLRIILWVSLIFLRIELITYLTADIKNSVTNSVT